MPDLQDLYDDAMFDFGTNDYDSCIAKLGEILAIDPDYFDARLALGMAHYATAILKPRSPRGTRPRPCVPRSNSCTPTSPSFT